MNRRVYELQQRKMSSCKANGRIYKQNLLSEQEQLKVNYREVYSCLKNQMNFGWRKAFQRPPKCFQNSLEDARKVYKEFINK